MALAYTPGLKVKESTIVRKVRRLPLAGEILVNVGDTVSFDTVVAKTEVPGEIFMVNAAPLLGLDPFDEQEELGPFMIKKEGDNVEKDEIIASRKGFLGLFKSTVKSPIKGKVELISSVTGKVGIRAPPILVEVKAYMPGRVAKVFPKEGVLIENEAALIQGIFGIGGEEHGELMMMSTTPRDTLSADQIDSKCSGKTLVGGSLVTLDALKKAAEIGVKGIVVGGVEEKDLIDFLGYEVGVAVTGQEEVGLTLIITEGFGKMIMPEKTFEILKSFEGKEASIDGSTQIRAGVIRPEIIIPKEKITSIKSSEEIEVFSKGMEPGMRIRVIREPYFGALGHVLSLPVELQQIETESNVRVMEVKLDDGRQVVVPRANVEIIEE